MSGQRLLMIRSYALALVLAWLRLMFDLQEWLILYVQDEAMRDVTREWASWVIPLLTLGLWLSWLPAVRGRAHGPRPEPARGLAPAQAG